MARRGPIPRAPVERVWRAQEEFDNVTAHLVPGMVEGELWYMDMASGRGITGQSLELIRGVLRDAAKRLAAEHV
jgi:hypothetical protein